MCVYRGMDIGTAKPLEYMKEIPHHLIDILDPGETFDAKMFVEMAERLIEDIGGRGMVPIISGGTYLYLQALLYGIEETPPPNWRLRRKLYSIAEAKGREFLYRRLKTVDPIYSAKINPSDVRRTVRALEVFIESGRPFSSYHRWSEPRYSYLGVFVTRNGENLENRIRERVNKMLREGLVNEVRRLVERGFEGFITATQAIGYKELIPYLRGEASIDEAVERIVKNTKEYAKRQIRWFRKRGWLEINLDRIGEEEALEVISDAFRQIRRSL